MHSFTIRDIENLCRIKAHTLRIWEQRYNIHLPKRKDSNHRLYDNEDLKYMLRIAHLYHHGYKISNIAKLSNDDINRLTTQGSDAEEAISIAINQLTEAALDLDTDRFDKILHNALLHSGLEHTMMNIVYPFLNRVGLLWITGNMIPAQEHFASNLIIKKIWVAINGLPKPRKASPHNIICFAPRYEGHEIPPLFMQYLLKKNGIHSVYLGANVPDEIVHEYCKTNAVTHAYIHIMTLFAAKKASAFIEEFSTRFPKIKMVISGDAMPEDMTNTQRLILLRTKEEMMSFAKGKL